MFEHLSIRELINAIETIHGKILIPDEEVRLVWDVHTKEYVPIDSCDQDPIRTCLQTQKTQSAILKTESDGHTSFMEHIYVPVFSPGIKIILKLSLDITARTIYERQLSEERDRLADITLNSPDAIITLDANHKIISWNRGAESIFGYPAAVMIGKTIAPLFHTDNPIESLLADGDKNQRCHCITQDGRTIFCEMNRVRHRSQDEVFVFRDKTHQKHLEDEIRRSLENISKINEIGSLIHTSLNLDDILNKILVATTAGQGLRFNRAFLFLISDDRQFLDGKKAIGPSNPHEAGLLWQELDAEPKSLHEILSSYKAVLDGKDLRVNAMITAIHIPLADDGEYRAFIHAIRYNRCVRLSANEAEDMTETIRRQFESDHLAIVPLIAKNEPLGALVVDNAITGRPISDQDLAMLQVFAGQIVASVENAMLYEKLINKVGELEEAHASLRHSQESLIRSEKLAAVGSMSAKVAHEIRNPLVAIGGFARLLLKQEPSATSQEYINVMVNECMRLEHILNDILAYTRSIPATPISQPLKPIIENALDLLAERWKHNGITLDTDLPEKSPVLALDRDQVLQAILNILINACQAMPDGGTLTVRLDAIGDPIRLVIADTGEGMDHATTEKIFDPFFTTKKTGSGLGLVIVHDILNQHGIRYNVTSEPHRGTQFTLFFDHSP